MDLLHSRHESLDEWILGWRRATEDRRPGTADDGAMICDISPRASASISAVGEKGGKVVNCRGEVEVWIDGNNPDMLGGGNTVSLVVPPLGVGICRKAGLDGLNQRFLAAASAEGAPDILKIARFQ